MRGVRTGRALSWKRQRIASGGLARAAH